VVKSEKEDFGVCSSVNTLWFDGQNQPATGGQWGLEAKSARRFFYKNNLFL